MIETLPSLAELTYLKRVSELLGNGTDSLTRTTIAKYLGVSVDALQPALDYGEEQGVLKRLPQNYYRLLREFNLQERYFYPAAMQAIDGYWQGNTTPEDRYFLEKTANLNSRVSGRWTLPDFVLVSRKTFPWTVGVEFDIVTFEVKAPEECNVIAVFEALAHSRSATRSYVVFPVDPLSWEKADAAQAQRIKDECSRHGIGLLFIENAAKKPRAVPLIKAQKKNIDHMSADQFLEAILPASRKSTISGWKSV